MFLYYGFSLLVLAEASVLTIFVLYNAFQRHHEQTINAVKQEI